MATADIPKMIEDYTLRFRSGNDVPVERIWMTREMWDELRKVLERAESDRKTLENLKWIWSEVMDSSEVKYSVNIRSPFTIEEFNEDESFLESIGRDNFRPSGAYNFNVHSVKEYGSPCKRPGFKYMFWFKDRAVADKMAEAYQSTVELVEAK